MDILGVEAEAAEAVEAEEDVETGEVEADNNAEVEVKVLVVKVVKDRGPIRDRLTPGTRPNVIKIHPHSKPVFVTGRSGRVLIFVWNQLPVLGRSSGSQSLINEISTSSTSKKPLKRYMTYFIMTSYRK